MKLSVTTLGCPDWTLEDIVSRCKAFGYQGVELRGIGPHVDLAQSPYFADDAAIGRARDLFTDAGLEVSCVDSSTRLGDSDWAENLEQGQRMVDLAAALESPFVRVFGGDGSAALVAERLRVLGDYAAEASKDVIVLLETHDAYSTGAQAAEALCLADHPRVGALWDLHHPFRHGESPQQTYDALRPYVRHTHVKDSILGGTYCFLGAGDIPIREMLELLARGGYDGWISLEWEKRWVPALAEPDAAFPQYAGTLRRYLAEIGA